MWVPDPTVLPGQFFIGQPMRKMSTKDQIYSNRENVFVHESDFPLTSSNDDLNKYILSSPKLDPVYITTHCGKLRQGTRNWIEALWGKYHPYAEPRFLERLRANGSFHSFSWQMYIATVLLDRGYALQKNSGEGPDIQLIIDGKNFWIEAIVTTPGRDEKAKGMPLSGDIYDSLDPRVARINNALTTKYQKYKNKYLNKRCGNNEPFLIAINGTRTDTLMGTRALEAAVYARGNDVLKRASTYSYQDGFYELRESIEVQKDGETVTVPTNYFCNDSYQELSGVIYCETHIINANNSGGVPEDHLYLATNGYAKNQIGKVRVGKMISRTKEGAITSHV